MKREDKDMRVGRERGLRDIKENLSSAGDGRKKGGKKEGVNVQDTLFKSSSYIFSFY